jgi:hypothetical protein
MTQHDLVHRAVDSRPAKTGLRLTSSNKPIDRFRPLVEDETGAHEFTPQDSELMRRRPLRHFHWLLHNDIERDHEAESDRKEVDRHRRDVGCGAVLEAF